MEKIKTVVNIAGKEYTICGTDSEEHIHRVALRVNGKYEELKRANPDLNNVQLSMLTALNIADDFVKTDDENTALKKELTEVKGELEKLKKKPAVRPDIGGV